MVRHHYTTAAALTLVLLGGAAHADQLITFTGTILRGNLATFGAHAGDTYTQSFIIKTGAVNHAGNNQLLSKFKSTGTVTPGDITSMVNFSGHTVIFTATQGATVALDAANYFPSYAHGEFLLGTTTKGVGNGVTGAATNGGVIGYAYTGTGPLTSSQVQIAGPGFTNFSLWKWTAATFQGKNSQGVFGKFLVNFTNVSTRDLSLPTPEPGQYAAFAIGLLGLGALIVRKRKSLSAS
jgi:hypothetical protein